MSELLGFDKQYEGLFGWEVFTLAVNRPEGLRYFAYVAVSEGCGPSTKDFMTRESATHAAITMIKESVR